MRREDLSIVINQDDKIFLKRKYANQDIVISFTRNEKNIYYLLNEDKFGRNLNSEILNVFSNSEELLNRPYSRTISRQTIKKELGHIYRLRNEVLMSDFAKDRAFVKFKDFGDIVFDVKNKVIISNRFKFEVDELITILKDIPEIDHNLIYDWVIRKNYAKISLGDDYFGDHNEDLFIREGERQDIFKEWLDYTNFYKAAFKNYKEVKSIKEILDHYQIDLIKLKAIDQNIISFKELGLYTDSKILLDMVLKITHSFERVVGPNTSVELMKTYYDVLLKNTNITMTDDQLDFLTLNLIKIKGDIPFEESNLLDVFKNTEKAIFNIANKEIEAAFERDEFKDAKELFNFLFIDHPVLAFAVLYEGHDFHKDHYFLLKLMKEPDFNFYDYVDNKILRSDTNNYIKVLQDEDYLRKINNLNILYYKERPKYHKLLITSLYYFYKLLKDNESDTINDYDMQIISIIGGVSFLYSRILLRNLSFNKDKEFMDNFIFIVNGSFQDLLIKLNTRSVTDINLFDHILSFINNKSVFYEKINLIERNLSISFFGEVNKIELKHLSFFNHKFFNLIHLSNNRDELAEAALLELSALSVASHDINSLSLF